MAVGLLFIAVRELRCFRELIEGRVSNREGWGASQRWLSSGRRRDAGWPRRGPSARRRGTSRGFGGAQYHREVLKTGLWECVEAMGAVNREMVERGLGDCWEGRVMACGGAFG